MSVLLGYYEDIKVLLEYYEGAMKLLWRHNECSLGVQWE